MTGRAIDPHAIDGKFPSPTLRYDVIVVGAGRSGVAAALEAAGAGRSVLLVDENPVPGNLIGNDVPYYFGGRATTAVQNSDRMVETLFINTPGLEAAIEAGVELQLGVCAWGVYRNGPLVGGLPEPVLALADRERSWLVGFETLVLAVGARDLPLAFPGWNQPGVMGAAALKQLVQRYDAFAGQTVVVAGSHDLGLSSALLAHEKGIAVAAVLEVRDAPQGDPKLVAQVQAAGIPIHCGVWPVEAKGGIDGVEAIVISSGDTVVCDTLVMAVGLVPMIELVDAMHGARAFDARRGGWVPLSSPRSGGGGPAQPVEGGWAPDIQASQSPDRPLPPTRLALTRDPPSPLRGRESSEATITVTGSCAGLTDTGFDHIAYRTDWLNALGGACGGDTIVCQCEEVTLADLLGVQPPKYLDRPPAIQARSLKSLLADGPVNQDQIKRLTRSGMGVCQGRRCRDQVAMMLAMESGVALADLPLATHRAPVRPLPLNVIADWDENETMRAGWDVWMGIPTQWVPYADIGTPWEEENRRVLGGNMSL